MRKASAFFAQAELDRPLRVEVICRVQPAAPSTYFRHELLARDPTRRSPRAQGDAVLRATSTSDAQPDGVPDFAALAQPLI